VSEDWAAVARAINQRMAELELNQRELIERSRVSKATVGELMRNSARRRRSARTLEALSLALDWHPRHLHAVLTGQRIPTVGEPAIRSDNDIPGRLDAIEYQLAQIAAQLRAVDELTGRLDDIRHEVETVVRLVSSNHRNAEA
jgi:transcriptional regulator with XRE-family HTH domain